MNPLGLHHLLPSGWLEQAHACLLHPTPTGSRTGTSPVGRPPVATVPPRPNTAGWGSGTIPSPRDPGKYHHASSISDTRVTGNGTRFFRVDRRNAEYDYVCSLLSLNLAGMDLSREARMECGDPTEPQ